MPLPITHALVPVAVALVRPGRKVPWLLVAAAAAASVLPDIDSFSATIWGTPDPRSSLPFWWHRGATHSLFVAIGTGLLAAALHRHLKVRPLVAGVAVAGAMASHGILDMLADQGVPVAYLWPLTSQRFFADWRPIHSSPIVPPYLSIEMLDRLRTETWQLTLPMLLMALLFRGLLALSRSILRP